MVLLAPGMGDGIQAAKAGILEVGDVYVVNKFDRDGAQQTRREVRSMLSLGERPDGAWRPPVLGTVSPTGEGVPEVTDQLEAHLSWARGSGALQARRRRRARDEIESLAVAGLRRRWAGTTDTGRLDELAALVVEHELDPYTAADRLTAEK